MFSAADGDRRRHPQDKADREAHDIDLTGDCREAACGSLIVRSDRQFEIELLDSGVEAFAFTVARHHEFRRRTRGLFMSPLFPGKRLPELERDGVRVWSVDV